jgi:prophage regulatory protein
MESALEYVLLRLPQVEQATGLKKSSLYQRIKEGTFPSAVQLGPKSVAWKSEEIQKWIATRPRVSQKEGET